MESVALPLPALAATTSVPPSCVRFVSASITSSVIAALGVACDQRGRMVMPAWPPTTGTSTFAVSRPFFSA